MLSKVGKFILLSSLIMFAGCKIDESYSINDVKDINTDITLFSENGIDIPLGETQEINVDSLISKLDEDTRKFIEKNGDSYLLKTKGNYSLDEEIQKLDMSSLTDINGVNIDETIHYELDFKKEDFKVNSQDIEEKINFDADVNLDFGVKEIDISENIQAEISKYSPTESQLSIEPSPLTRSQTLLPSGEKQGILAVLETLSGGDLGKEIKVPEGVMENEIAVNAEVSVDQVSTELDGIITKVEDLTLDPDAQVNIDLEIVNNCFTDGSVCADLSVDLSDLFKIEGRNSFEVKEYLNRSNSYRKSITKRISDLVYENKENKIIVTPSVSLVGTVSMSGIATTCNKFKEHLGNNLELAITISYRGLKVADATLTFSEMNVDDIPQMRENISFDYKAENVNSINYVKLDAPLNLNMTLDECIGSLSIKPALTLDIPKGMGFRFGTTELADGGNVKILDGSQSLGKSSPITKTVYVTSITPSVAGNAITYNGDIVMNASAKVYGKVKLSEIKDTERKIAIAAKLNGSAAVSEYSVNTGSISAGSASLSKEISFKMKGGGNLGAMTVIPTGKPEIKMDVIMPEIEGLTLLAGENGLIFELPKMLVPKAKDLSAYHFNANENKITIQKNEVIPSAIKFGVERLELNPEKVSDDEYEVKDEVKVHGDIVLGPTTVTDKIVKEIQNSETTVILEVPEMTADKVTIKDELSFDIESENEINLIKADQFPKEVKYVKELTLNEVYATISATFGHLPDIGKDFKVDAEIEMPSFITPSTVSLKGTVKKGIFYTEDGKKEFKVKVEKINDIDLSTGKDINGTIKIKGKISASSPSIEISSLENSIDCTVNVILGNTDGKINIGKAIGKVEYEIPGHFSISFEDLPAELKTDDTVLDIADPEIRLAVTTNIGIPISGNITITPWKGGKAITERAISLGEIILPCSESADNTLSDNYLFNNSGIKTLIRQVPDSLVIDLKANVAEDKDCLIEPSAQYTANMDYEFALPLELGKDLSLGFHADFEFGDIAQYLVGNKVGITGNVLNDTPLVLSATLDVLNKDGSVIYSPDSRIAVEGQNTTRLEFFLDIPQTVNYADIAKGSIVLHIGSIGGAIKPSHKLQLTDLTAHLPEGVTIKPNIQNNQK